MDSYILPRGWIVVAGTIYKNYDKTFLQWSYDFTVIRFCIKFK